MARNLGEAFIAILPQTGGFRTMLEAQLKKATAGVDAQVKLQLDTAQLDAKIAASRAKIAALQKQTSTVTLAADATKLNTAIAAAEARLAALRHQGSDVALKADASQFDAVLAAMETKAAS